MVEVLRVGEQGLHRLGWTQHGKLGDFLKRRLSLPSTASDPQPLSAETLPVVSDDVSPTTTVDFAHDDDGPLHNRPSSHTLSRMIRRLVVLLLGVAVCGGLAEQRGLDGTQDGEGGACSGALSECTRLEAHERDKRGAWEAGGAGGASGHPCRGGEHIDGRWVAKAAAEMDVAPCCDAGFPPLPGQRDPEVCGPSEAPLGTPFPHKEDNDPDWYFWNYEFFGGRRDFLTHVDTHGNLNPKP